MTCPSKEKDKRPDKKKPPYGFSEIGQKNTNENSPWSNPSHPNKTQQVKGI